MIFAPFTVPGVTFLAIPLSRRRRFSLIWNAFWLIRTFRRLLREVGIQREGHRLYMSMIIAPFLFLMMAFAPMVMMLVAVMAMMLVLAVMVMAMAAVGATMTVLALVAVISVVACFNASLHYSFIIHRYLPFLFAFV